MMAKGTENKEVGWRIDDNLHNGPIGAAECYSIIQDLPQGVDGESRVGDRVKPKSLELWGDITLNPNYNPDTRAIYVRVIIASQKSVKQSTAGAVAGIDTAHLLRSGIAGAAETNFDGTITSLRYPLNDNKFRKYHDRVYKLLPTGAGGFPLLQAQFSFKKALKSLPASLTYDAGAGDYCNNFAPFFAVGYCYADGSPADIAQQRIQTRVWSKLTYEDA